MTTLTTISAMPEVRVSNLTQLEWAVSQTAQFYGETSLRADIAWDTFLEAVDEEISREAKDALQAAAVQADEDKSKAYQEWEDAKVAVLAYWN